MSFERAHRRAALILWPQAGQFDVLLQAGIGAALRRVALECARLAAAAARESQAVDG